MILDSLYFGFLGKFLLAEEHLNLLHCLQSDHACDEGMSVGLAFDDEAHCHSERLDLILYPYIDMYTCLYQ